jgi:ATP-dependent Lon protease
MNYTPLSKILNKEQGTDDVRAEINNLVMLLDSSGVPDDLREKAKLQLQRIDLALQHGGNVNQLDMLTKYVDWIISLPWKRTSEDVLDIEHAKKVMDQNHFGLEVIKKRVLEYISVLILQKQQGGKKFHAPILFFVGLAGTGKTTFAKSIAETLGREFVRVPFGGLSSALDLRGVSKVQPEAEPGQIMKSLRRINTKNPVILLDELDRITPSAHGEIMGVLIELLDPEQNNHFVDHYIDYPFDLSQVIFVATANNTQTISTAVMDRLEVIQMPSYKDEEKIQIGKNYVLPRLIRESGIKPEGLIVEDEVWKHIARLSGFDPGIRSVERKIESIVRTVAFKMVNKQGESFSINMANLKEFMES